MMVFVYRLLGMKEKAEALALKKEIEKQKRIYKNNRAAYLEGVDDLDCGTRMAEVMRPWLADYRKKYEDAAIKLVEIDKYCPLTFRLYVRTTIAVKCKCDFCGESKDILYDDFGKFGVDENTHTMPICPECKETHEETA